MKKLIKDIGDLNTLIHKERRNLFLYDDSNIISDTFFTELDKNIQRYGFISLQCNHNDEKLINSKNRLLFKTNYNTKKRVHKASIRRYFTA